MKKKIAFVQPILTPYTILRFEELAKDGNLDVFLFLERHGFPNRPDWTSQDVIGCKVKVLESPLIKTITKNSELGYEIEGVRAIPYRLPYFITKYKPHIVMVSNATELVFSLAPKLLSSYKIGLLVEDTRHTVGTKSWGTHLLKRAIYKKADFFLPMSEESTAYLEKMDVTRNVYRTSWSIDISRFSSVPDSLRLEELKHNFALSGKITFVTVARLIPLKGVMNLIHAWDKLDNALKQKICLVVLGEGPEKKKILSYIGNKKLPNIFLIGQKPHSEMVYYYNLADVFILPTLQDVFSLSLMEAMACGLPVLTTKYCGGKELVRDGENGFIFDSADIEDIHKSILKVIKQKDNLQQMGERSRGIIKRYSNEVVIRKLREILWKFM